MRRTEISVAGLLTLSVVNLHRRRMAGCKNKYLALPLGLLVTAFSTLSSATSSKDLADLSLDQLSAIQITSVSKRAESLSDAPASIFVITNEDIHRAGARSIPEALRLAPNLQVARIDSNQYAISARGFNTTTTNKLQVLIDGRSVYTQLYSGVFWDVQDVVLEDIERIEVISGPGGTLWGSNAVNGVINIITRSAHDTVGALVHAGAGSDERNATARYGGKIGDTTSYRVYAKGVSSDSTETGRHIDAENSWGMRQAGFRLDSGDQRNSFVLQGDAYDGSIDQLTLDDKQVSGNNLLGRWRSERDNGSSLQIQAYYDHTEREYPGVFSEVLNTYDLDVQHQFSLNKIHSIVWGGGYRQTRDEIDNGVSLAFLPADRILSWTSFFAQDEVALSANLHLTVGAKLERNRYTGWEFQPNARLALKLANDALVWSSISRAVRTPSRFDTELYAPARPPYLLAGGADFVSETLTAYEIGYRAQFNRQFSFSISTFYNDYDNLRSIETVPGRPLVIANKMKSNAWGVEAWGTYHVTNEWRLSAGYNHLSQNRWLEDDSTSFTGTRGEGNDPMQQLSLRSATNLPHNVQFDLMLRSIARLPDPKVPGYTVLDSRIGWDIAPTVELSLTGTNLFDHRHAEFGTAPNYSEFRRTLYAGILWKL